MSLLDLLFPKRCVRCKTFGSYLCPSCFSYISFLEHGVCIVCQKQAIGGATHPRCLTRYTIDGVFSSLAYTGVVKKLLYQFKYQPNLTDLKNLLTELFYEGLIQKELFYSLLSKKSLLVPIPLHASKLKKRGYNQSLLLAKGLGTKLNLPVSDCLIRSKKTTTQVGLSKEERRENIKDAFAINKTSLAELKQYSQIFLVDDIATSGATLNEAAKLLKKTGVTNVWGVTLAHGQ